MPLTAFSRATGEELDVDQVIRRLAGTKEVNTTALLLAGIPDAWRQVIREDMECPSCFTLGADLVRDGVSATDTKLVVRQACFRYPTHRPQCDFARPGISGTSTPDNLVAFGSTKTVGARDGLTIMLVSD